MIKKTTIKFTHKGEDYYGIELNKTYYEISLAEGKNIRVLLNLIRRIITKED